MQFAIGLMHSMMSENCLRIFCEQSFALKGEESNLASHRQKRRPQVLSVRAIYHTVADIQKLLSVTERTVLLWIDSGELKAINVGRSPNKKKPRWRISQAALDEFERGRSATPSTPATPRRRKSRSAEIVDMFP
jgi:excisionase family DNA binding protein